MNKRDITSQVMQRIAEDDLRMRPHWYFTVLTAASLTAILVLSGLSIYLVNIFTLTLRIQLSQRPMYGARQKLTDLLAQFPWWAILLALASMSLLVWLLRQRSNLYRYGIGWTIAAVVSLSLVLGVVLSFTPINQLHPGPGNQGGQHQGQSR